MTALNPLHRVGAQVAEPLLLHRGMSRAAALARRRSSCSSHVRLREPERLARAYPFALSGGERQRAMIAMAMGCGRQPHHRRRADDGARRHRAGAHSRSHRRTGGGIEDGDPAGQPRSRGDRRALRPRHRHVCGRDHGERPGRACSREPRNPYTLALLEARPRPGAPRGARLKTIPGAPPVAQGQREGCPFAGRCALTIDHLPQRAAARGRLRRRSRLSLPSRRRGGFSRHERRAAARGLQLVKTYPLARPRPVCATPPSAASTPPSLA